MNRPIAPVGNFQIKNINALSYLGE